MRLLNVPSGGATSPASDRRPWPTSVKYALRAAAVLFLLILIAVGAAVAVVFSGPTEIGFLRDRIEARLQQAVGEAYAVAVEKTVVEVDPVLGLVVDVGGVVVRDGAQAVVARVPSTRVAVNPLAFLRFGLEVTSIEVASPELSLVRSSLGQVYLGNADTSPPPPRAAPVLGAGATPVGPDGGFPDLLAAVTFLDRGIQPSIDAAARAGFESLTIVDGSIDVWDAAGRRLRRFPGADLAVSLDPQSGKVVVNVGASGYGGRWTATLDREVDPATGGRVVAAMFSQVALADLFPTLGEDTGRLSTDIPIYGRASVRFAAHGAVEEAVVRLDAGAGIIRFGESRETALLDEATVKLHWDIPNRMIVVEPSPFYFGRTRGIFSGWVRPDGKPGEHRYAYQFAAPGAVLAPSDSNELPMIVERIAAGGTIDLDARLLSVDHLVIEASDASVTAAGTLGYGGDRATAALAVSFSPMELGALKQIWAPFIAPSARRWVLEHVISGRLVEGKFAAAVPTAMLFGRERKVVQADQMRLDLRLEDVAFTTYGDLPPVLHASGNVVLAGSTFGVDIDSAEVETPSGGIVAITAGAFAVDNVFKQPAEGDIAVQLSGDAVAVGELADAKPFRALARQQITPADLSGKGDVSVIIKAPLVKGVTEAEIDWKVSIVATGLASKAPVQGHLFSEADVSMAVTPDEIVIKGKAKIDGVMADVSMSQPLTLGGAVAGPGAQYARMTLDAAARKRLGIGLDEILGGTVGATMRNLQGEKGQHYDLDLKRARLVMPGLGWSKGIGVPASLGFDLKPATGGYSVENIVMQGLGFGLTGRARLDEGYGLVSADIDQFSLRPGDKLGFTLTRTKTGYAIVARGSSFDLRGFIVYLKEGTTSGGDPADISIDGQLDRVVGFNQEVIAGARLNLAAVGGYPQRVAFSGVIGDSEVRLDYSDLRKGATLAASSNDAGRLFRFFDIYTHIEGGRLTASGQRPGPSGPIAGTFEVTDFNVVDEPALQRLFPARGGVPAGGGNLARAHFDRVLTKFRKDGMVLSVDDAVIRGQAVGATLNGRIDFATSRLVVNGTYLPAYEFNNSFSRVPFIGPVLSGGASEGLFGVTFRVEGPISRPTFLFNPLSAVAPGIFRKIFEFR